jgi:flavin-dependent dehydrogenase
LKPITIIGGGLAGLALGIGLRQRSVPAVVWEAGHYPRHRVCGEFINGHGQETLMRLGLRQTFLAAGARIGTTAAFYSGRTASPVRPLPRPSLSLARFAMDALLAQQFKQSGGELHDKQRWKGDRLAEGIVCASGRHLASQETRPRWFGLKVHARNVSMAADLEMHASNGGYVGLCRLSDGVVNVCGLFRHSNGTHGAPAWRERLRGGRGTLLNKRLGNADFIDRSFCSVAGVSLRPKRAADQLECCIGDALTMIPPVTGNGMSMAFEAAELAVEPLLAYSRGEIPWERARELVALHCDKAFARRLKWARGLQSMMMLAPSLGTAPVSLALRSDLLWRTLFAQTR